MRCTRRTAVIVVALSAAIAAATPVLASGPTHDPDAERTSRDLISRERSDRGLNALRWSDDLAAIARAHSRDQAEDARVYHNDDLPDDVGSGWIALGENVGRGAGPTSVHNAFMNSSGHRANIIGRYTHVGIGAYRTTDHVYITQVFIERDDEPASGGSSSSTSEPEPEQEEPRRSVKDRSSARRPASTAPARRPAPGPAPSAPTIRAASSAATSALVLPPPPGPSQTVDALERLSDLYG